DKEGKVIRTVERFENVKLPAMVSLAITERFPGWTIKKDVYRVNYYDGDSTREYKVILTKGDETRRVKLDGYGKFL
ncbi:MAG: nicotinate-nucleotide adenylyltransferase, partial [Bacteroidia bacterium]|nr:nicotinate-nucleotide adenylyltransferase [Bacteroidia bacterium]